MLINVQVSDSSHLVVGFGKKEVEAVKERKGNRWLGITPGDQILHPSYTLLIRSPVTYIPWNSHRQNLL